MSDFDTHGAVILQSSRPSPEQKVDQPMCEVHEDEKIKHLLPDLRRSHLFYV